MMKDKNYGTLQILPDNQPRPPDLCWTSILCYLNLLDLRLQNFHVVKTEVGF